MAASPFFQSFSPPPPPLILLPSVPPPPSTLITDAAIYDPNTVRAASVSYDRGVTVAVLVFIISIFLIAYCCTKPLQSKVDRSPRWDLRRSPSSLELPAVEIVEGLSEATLMSYPKLLYSKALTCPVCRTSPLPTPMSTPMAEVAPLAAVQPMQSKEKKTQIMFKMWFEDG